MTKTGGYCSLPKAGLEQWFSDLSLFTNPLEVPEAEYWAPRSEILIQEVWGWVENLHFHQVPRQC